MKIAYTGDNDTLKNMIRSYKPNPTVSDDTLLECMLKKGKGTMARFTDPETEMNYLVDTVSLHEQELADFINRGQNDKVIYISSNEQQSGFQKSKGYGFDDNGLLYAFETDATTLCVSGNGKIFSFNAGLTRMEEPIANKNYENLTDKITNLDYYKNGSETMKTYLRTVAESDSLFEKDAKINSPEIKNGSEQFSIAIPDNICVISDSGISVNGDDMGDWFNPRKLKDFPGICYTVNNAKRGAQKDTAQKQAEIKTERNYSQDMAGLINDLTITQDTKQPGT